MKKIYICENPNDIKRVYGSDEKFYNREEILNNPDAFKDTEYIFSTWGMSKFSPEEIKACLPNLKCVFYGAGSVQYFAHPFLECGVKVFSAWAANAVPVAEYTVAQIILANKSFFHALPISRDREAGKELVKNFVGNYGATVGIIGAGMIGKLVIDMLKAYKLDVLVFDPFLPDEKAKELGVEKVTLEQLFKRCNVVSNHLANNEQTKGMLNEKLFSKMLPYSTFLNTGRGAQVVEADLIKVLKDRPDVVAILDVTDPEPPLPDSEFFDLPNCYITPHIAGSNGEEVKRMGEYMLDEYERFIKGEPCKYEVTLEMLKTMA
ncbi:MAG: hydroxyacid dehydrogenase [Clostridia bacterium]|nr:hydroxyacid dehydrogenase [Clostridia bacterium]